MKWKHRQECELMGENQLKWSNLQYQKPDLDPNQNGQLMTAEVI